MSNLVIRRETAAATIASPALQNAHHDVSFSSTNYEHVATVMQRHRVHTVGHIHRLDSFATGRTRIPRLNSLVPRARDRTLVRTAELHTSNCFVVSAKLLV